MKKMNLTAVTTAAVLWMAAVPVLPAQAAEFPLRVEFESGTLTDCEEREPITWTQIDEDGFGNVCDMTGWSGDSYVYIDRKDAAVTVTVNMEEDGYYGLNIGYIQCFGTPDNPNKTQYLLVNGESQGEILFPFNSGNGWETVDAGYVHLNKGENTITVKSYWGYTFLDYVDITEAPSYLTNLSPADLPCDPNASPEAVKLYLYLKSVYGKHILAGQQEYCGSHCYNKNAYESTGQPINYLEDNEAEFQYLEKNTGKQPAVRGIDFLFYNTTQPYFDDAPERVIAWYKDKGGIPTVTFHWNVPTDGKDSTTAAFYVESTGNTPFTNFSITNAVKEGTWEHEKIDADIKLLAEQLGKAAKEHVPIIFRPLHEAEGGWFWWGAEGPEPCKQLYRYLYKELTETYGLHNLIWEWTGYTYATSKDWYPGDDVVDLIGYDKYNAVNGQPNLSAISATFYSLVSQTEGQKMVAMSENDSIPGLDNLINDRAAWLYFCPWYMNYLTSEQNNPLSNLKDIYQSEYCITLDELPDWDTYDPEIPDGTTATTTTTTTTGKTGLRGDVSCDGTVDVKDAVLLARVIGMDEVGEITEEGLANGELDGKTGLSTDDLSILLKAIANLIKL